MGAGAGTGARRPIGTLRAAVGSFGYFNLDADNIRNIRAYGGGALMDIGCYPIKVSRMLFGEEPRRVSAAIAARPAFGTDMLTSATLEFPSGHGVSPAARRRWRTRSMQIHRDQPAASGWTFLSMRSPAKFRACASTMAAT